MFATGAEWKHLQKKIVKISNSEEVLWNSENDILLQSQNMIWKSGQ